MNTTHSKVNAITISASAKKSFQAIKKKNDMQKNTQSSKSFWKVYPRKKDGGLKKSKFFCIKLECEFSSNCPLELMYPDLFSLS